MMATFTGNNFPRHLQKRMLWAALMIAIVIKCCLLYFYALVDGDKGLQALAAINIAQGNGYSIPEYNILTHQVQYIPLVEWPPLYSFLLVPFLFITDFNVEWSCMLLDACAGIAFLIFLLLLLRKLGFPVWLQALIILFKSAELNSAALISFPTDLWATASVIASFYFLLRLLERPSVSAVIVFAIVNVLPFYFRYMYLPVVFIMPAIYAWQHFKITSLRTHIYLLGGITLLLVSGLLFYNKIASDEAVFMITSQRGFYPETLLTMAPAFWAAFINVDFYCMQVSLHTSLSYKTFHDLLKATSAGMLLLLLVQYARNIKTLVHKSTPINQFFLYAGTLSISLLLIIVFLSLTHSPYSIYNKNDFWTFVMEERYFAVPGLTILITAIWWMFSTNSKYSLIKKICRVFFFAVAAIEILHAGYIILKQSSKSPENYSVYIYANEQRKALLANLIESERKKGMDILLVSDQYGYIMQGALEGVKVSRNVDYLKKDFSFSRPTTVLWAIPAERTTYYDKIIHKHNFQLIPVSENYSLYKMSFLPR